MSNEWVDVATETDLWVRAGISAVMKGTDIALFRIGDAHCAIDNLCTHGQARLCDGFVEGFEVECRCTRAASMCVPGCRLASLRARRSRRTWCASKVVASVLFPLPLGEGGGEGRGPPSVG